MFRFAAQSGKRVVELAEQFAIVVFQRLTARDRLAEARVERLERVVSSHDRWAAAIARRD